MSILRAPLPTLRFCLGVFIFIVPSASATYKYAYPDGSSNCFGCNLLNDTSYEACSKDWDEFTSSSASCYATDCLGQYYPPGFTNYANTFRECTSASKCIYDSNDYDAKGDYVAWEACCFKIGSPVCIFSLLVHHSELIVDRN